MGDQGLVQERYGCRTDLRNRRDIVDVIAQGYKEIEEQLTTTSLHLELHGAGAFEGAAAADDEGEVVGTELGVGVGSVGVGVAG